MSVSIVIPSYLGHLKYLNRLLLNISLFTVKPKEVIIAISSMNQQSQMYLRKLLLQYKNLQFIVVATSKRRNAAENRNKGIEKATGKYIMTIDCDDLVNIQKLEICRNIMEENSKINMLLTNYITFQKKYDIRGKLTDPYQNIYPCKVSDNGFHLDSIPSGKDLHHAHKFIKKNIIKNCKYDETKYYERLEDTELCNRIFKKYGGVYTIDNKLIGYYS